MLALQLFDVVGVYDRLGRVPPEDREGLLIVLAVMAHALFGDDEDSLDAIAVRHGHQQQRLGPE